MHFEQLPHFSGCLVECTICLGSFRNAEKALGLPCANKQLKRCGGRFHEECLRRWLERGDSCPFCRTPLHARREAGICVLTEGLRMFERQLEPQAEARRTVEPQLRRSASSTAMSGRVVS